MIFGSVINSFSCLVKSRIPTVGITMTIISRSAMASFKSVVAVMDSGKITSSKYLLFRSEERRVGKECRSSSMMSQAEDGIRDGHVTGVQTCALPISLLKHEQ